MLITRYRGCPYLVNPAYLGPTLVFPSFDCIQVKEVEIVLAYGDEHVVLTIEPNCLEARIQEHQPFRYIVVGDLS
jgi:hypothetical protein